MFPTLPECPLPPPKQSHKESSGVLSSWLKFWQNRNSQNMQTTSSTAGKVQSFYWVLIRKYNRVQKYIYKGTKVINTKGNCKVFCLSASQHISDMEAVNIFGWVLIMEAIFSVCRKLKWFWCYLIQFWTAFSVALQEEYINLPSDGFHSIVHTF